MINIENLSYSYLEGEPVLKDVTLSIEKGYVTGFFGGNGSGKSTLAKILAGEISSRINGAIRGIPESRILLEQNSHSNAFFDLTVDEHLSLYAPVLKYAEAKEWARQMEASRKRYPDELSGGQLQILGLMVLMEQGRELVILDEPTNHLAPENQRKILKWLRSHCVECKTYGIVISHNRELIESYCDEAYFFQDGVVSRYDRRREQEKKNDVSTN